MFSSMHTTYKQNFKKVTCPFNNKCTQFVHCTCTYNNKRLFCMSDQKRCDHRNILRCVRVESLVSEIDPKSYSINNCQRFSFLDIVRISLNSTYHYMLHMYYITLLT